MPILPQNYALPPASLQLWMIDEQEEQLLSLLEPFPTPEIKHLQKRRQWLASRLCLMDLLKQKGYHPEAPLPGKAPQLSSAPFSVSISHTDYLAAAMISPAKSCGLDLEKIGHKVPAIQHKFMRADEQQNPPDINLLTWQHLVWSAKETLFKLHQIGNLDFRDHLKVQAHRPGLLMASILKPGFEASFQLHYDIIKNQEFVLTFTDSNQQL